MKHRLPLFLIPSILVCTAAPALVAQGDAEPLSCADRSITASAVRTTEDVQAFVQCAYELVQEVGFEEARRASTRTSVGKAAQSISSYPKRHR